MDEKYDYENEEIKNKTSKVDQISQLYSGAREAFQTGSKSRKSDIDAINNRNKINNSDNNGNNLLGVVDSSKNNTSPRKNSSLPNKNLLNKKDNFEKKPKLDNSIDNIKQEDKDMLSSKKIESGTLQDDIESKNKKEETKKNVDEKVKKDAKENAKNKAINSKIGKTKVKGKASISFKLKILKIGLIVGAILFCVVLLAAIIGYFMDKLFPDLDIFNTNDWDFVNSKLSDEEYVKKQLKSAKSRLFTKTGVCEYTVGENVYSNIKVRLYKNDSFELVYSDDRLIDFDKYILGVAYQEIGGGTDSASEQAFKAQVIAARSYALTRGSKMDAKALKITEENGYTVINIRQTTNDQAYCDPDLGYYAGQLNNCSSSHPKLDDDSPLRKWAEEVSGMVLVDSEGKTVYTPYKSGAQNYWKSLAESGMTYDEILFKYYDANSNGYTISSSCSNSSSAKEAETWKQCDSRWGSMSIGSESICKSGCALTSVAIQIARSGVPVNVSGEFNPGSFMQAHKSFNGFYGNLIAWDVSKVAPNFKLISSDTIGGTKEEKINKIKKYADSGQYIVLGVRHGVGQSIGHYVAYNYSSNDEIYVFDPAGKTTGKLFNDYPAMANEKTTFQVIRYKVED